MLYLHVTMYTKKYFMTLLARKVLKISRSALFGGHLVHDFVYISLVLGPHIFKDNEGIYKHCMHVQYSHYVT